MEILAIFGIGAVLFSPAAAIWLVVMYLCDRP